MPSLKNRKRPFFASPSATASSEFGVSLLVISVASRGERSLGGVPADSRGVTSERPLAALLPPCDAAVGEGAGRNLAFLFRRQPIVNLQRACIVRIQCSQCKGQGRETHRWFIRMDCTYSQVALALEQAVHGADSATSARSHRTFRRLHASHECICCLRAGP